MATWVTHFRIAEELLKTDIPVSPIEFLVGNIGPDCGLIGEDGVPKPPKEITHFEVEGRISSASFYKQYLNGGKESQTREFSYYLGYYIHLVTDEGWLKLLVRKKKEKLYQDILNSPDYAGIVKKDWYGLDFLYLKHHKDNIFWTEFQHITDFPEYLSFFKKGQTFEQIRNITEFYQTSSIPEDHEFIYLTAAEVDDFVERTLQEVKEQLNEKLRLQLV
ncbi:zinc dependent phospholipase C family protein [Mangrovibacillus sp. Mu-81]|uniref:zinc dependent phospholipase C family protein n=1 Tax=Mangrovibacillus sp. Mu-81 TaxID=3121478 RepID=UPI002FE4A2E2